MVILLLPSQVLLDPRSLEIEFKISLMTSSHGSSFYLQVFSCLFCTQSRQITESSAVKASTN